MPGVRARYLGPDQMVVLSLLLYSGSGPHGLALCLSFLLGLKPFAKSQRSGLMPYTLPGSSKTFSLGRKKHALCFLFFLPLCWQPLLSQQLARLLYEYRYPKECHYIMRIEYLVPGLSTYILVGFGGWWLGQSAFFHLLTYGMGAKIFLMLKTFFITLIWSELHIDEEPKTQEKSWAQTLWIIHYSLVYSIHICWISSTYKLCTAMVSLSFERLSYFNQSSTFLYKKS